MPRAFSTPSSFDPIALVEAAYTQGGTLPHWLESVLEPAASALDCGNGVQAMICVPPGERNAQIVDIVSRDTMTSVEGFFRRATHDVPAEEQGMVRAHFSGRLRSLSEHLEYQSSINGFANDTSHPFRDYLAFFTRGAGPLDLIMVGLATRQVKSTLPQRRTWAKLGSHLSAGLRLRIRLASHPDFAPEEAVLAPDGRLLHAEGDARTCSTRDHLRQLAQGIDRAKSSLRKKDPEEAVSFWPSLVSGRWSLIDRWDSDGRRFLVARYNPPFEQDPRVLTPRERQATELAAQGASNQEIGIQLNVSESTAATHVAQAVRKLGLRRREELGEMVAAGFVSRFSFEIDQLIVRSTRLPSVTSSAALTGLTPAERAVAALVATGKSNREIAILRNTASRTVAVQLQSIFRKLAVRSRAELVARVQRESEEGSGRT